MTSDSHENNVRNDMEKLIRQNNLLLLEIQDLKEDQVNNRISVDSLENRLDRKSERISQLEKTIQDQKEKTIRCESDIRNQKDKIRSQKEQIEKQRETVQNQKEQIEKYRKTIQKQKEKIKRCETDIISQNDKIRFQKEQIEKQKKTMTMMRNSYAFLFGQAFVNAVKKPGINTVLLPYRWIRLTLRQWL
jgi:chromosome segregation ATPase